MSLSYVLWSLVGVAFPTLFGRDDDDDTKALARSTYGVVTHGSPDQLAASLVTHHHRVRAARPACCYPFPSGFVLERSIHPWLACSRKHAYAIDRCEIERLTRPLSCMSALVTNCRGGSEARAPSAQRQPRQHAILSILVRELKLPCCV